MKTFAFTVPVVGLLVLPLFFQGGTAVAQVDPTFHEIYQNDELVGVILVPDRDPDACQYVEYWFLFEEYIYPGARNPIATLIQPVKELSDEALWRIVERSGHWVIVKASEKRPECLGRR